MSAPAGNLLSHCEVGVPVGTGVGDDEGWSDVEGAMVGLILNEGDPEGLAVGLLVVGVDEGEGVGLLLGLLEGDAVGVVVGLMVGDAVGKSVGGKVYWPSSTTTFALSTSTLTVLAG